MKIMLMNKFSISKLILLVTISGYFDVVGSGCEFQSVHVEGVELHRSGNTHVAFWKQISHHH